MQKYSTAAEAIQYIESNERVFIHGGAATPTALINALTERHDTLKNVEIVHVHTEGEIPYVNPAYADAFHVNSFFTGHNLRPYTGKSNVQYIPVFLSEIPALFRRGIMNIDTALIQVSVPDQHGFCSLGTSVDIAKAATDTAKKIIALVNPNMPRTHGDGLIHSSRFIAAVQDNSPLFEIPSHEISETENAIGRNVASLVEDGATLQFGIGGIPNAVLRFLHDHKDLGVHTEMFTHALLPLIEKGVINGRMKKNHPGKIISTFVMGNRALYDFIDDNPMVWLLDAAYVNDTAVIRRNPKVTAINSAVEIDLTGQVCADSVGTHIISGVGGQMDFIRGASLSEGGKPIIAMSSLTAKGESKIVPMLKNGAGVVTTRAHMHYVITEFGVADLYGRNLMQRAKALIGIAHPKHREALERSLPEIFG
jgi:4-hydroxybutyrate CoA-transferase